MKAEGSEARHGALPVATYLLIAAQVIVWLVVRRFLVPGGAWLELALAPGSPSWVGLLVSPFVHLDAAHLGVNVAVLWLFGTNLEREVGSLRFLLFYLGAAWFAALMQWAVAVSFHLDPDLNARDPAIGSSGAVAGVLGASLVRFPQSRLALPLFPRATFPTAPILVLWLVYTVIRALYNTVYGTNEGVGHWAHFAGFIFGLAAAQMLGMQHTARQEHLEAAAEEAANRHDLRRASLAWAALMVMRPTDLKIRGSLIATRLAMDDLPGARRVAREGIEALVRAGDRPPALDGYQAFLELVPDLDLPPGIRYRLGTWLADAGHDELAFRTFLESVRDDGPTAAGAAALYRAGLLALERLKSPIHAREAWERLLDQFPDSAWSEAARDGLRRLPSPG